MAKVVIENLSKTFQGPGGEPVQALRHANLVVEDKELVVLVGPSGCGKTTTLRLVAGLEEITSGTISIDGRIVNDVAPKDRDIAMVFQNYALYPHMTVYENMSFGLKLRKFAKAEIDRRVRETAEVLGLAPCLERRPDALSGGERQRVAVGRAIVRKPKVFLFDEPLSNLDAQMRVQMRAEISRLHRRLETTIIYVTHDQAEAMTLGDRIVVMKEGMIQQIADPLGVYEHPVNLFVAGFIGSPPMNFINGTLLKKGEGLAFVEQGKGSEGHMMIPVSEEQASVLKKYANQSVILGIRPEDLHLAGTEVNGGAVVRVRVEVVEPMGAETYIYLDTGASSVVARVRAGEKVGVGQELLLQHDMKKVHWFDAGTQATIG